MIIGIIQARMGSTRLPNKVLKKVNGIPLLKYQIDRVRKAKLLDKVVVATSFLEKDNQIVKLCHQLDMECFRGSENDVLSRYYECAKRYNATVIVRMTADCPLIDPVFIDKVIGKFFLEDVDYAANTVPPEQSTFPDGSDVEVFSMAALETAFHKCQNVHDREHVTFYFWKYGHNFKTTQLKHHTDYSQYRFAVDYPEDFEVVKDIINILNQQKKFGHLDEIVEIIEANPSIKNKNAQYYFGIGWQQNREILTLCPWCNSSKKENWGEQVRGFITAECSDCGLIYVQNRLNKRGLELYYQNYLSEVHQKDEQLNKQREKMYQLEFDLIKEYLNERAKVLDVGCSSGYFLDIFKKNGYLTSGVEFGQEAAQQVRGKHQLYFGEFPEIDISENFDLIIFRGVIEHVSYPKKYLEKAISLLNPGGLIYITSTPNVDSFCARLFKTKWNQHEPEAHLMHFLPKHFKEYFYTKGFTKLIEHYFYEETPYANPEEDVLKVAEAIKYKRNNHKIPFRSSAFWGNMMTLVFRNKNI